MSNEFLNVFLRFPPPYLRETGLSSLKVQNTQKSFEYRIDVLSLQYPTKHKKIVNG